MFKKWTNLSTIKTGMLLPVALGGLASATGVMADVPSDTYFSVAVSENSHNHYGENLLFLDFVENIPQSAQRHARTVLSIPLSAKVELDGVLNDWDPSFMTTIPGRVMNNYPLGDAYDATPTPISIASAYDDEYVYFALTWEDANHDASVNRFRWVMSNGKWVRQEHVKPLADSPASKAVNRDEKVAGWEEEDQVFMMFPIVDQDKHFTDGGLGCGGYCHANLRLSVDPAKGQIGDGASAMHTNREGDYADLWHWTSTRSMIAGVLLDGYIDFGEESYNGRKADDGEDGFLTNALSEPLRPQYVNKADFESGAYSKQGFQTVALSVDNLRPIDETMNFAEGTSLPFYIASKAAGSRADVMSFAVFDQEKNTWSLELRRKRQTSDDKDIQFVTGKDARPPSTELVQRGDPKKGHELFKSKACASCHGERGEGEWSDGSWVYPRNQRVSGPAIRGAASLDRPRRQAHIAHELKKWDEDPASTLMPYVTLTPQEAEDIASWLQTQFIPTGK